MQSAARVRVGSRDTRRKPRYHGCPQGRSYRSVSSLEGLQTAGAVADAVLVNVVLIQQCQQQIAGRYGLSRISQMTPAFESAVQSTYEHMGHVVVNVLIGIPHVAAIEHQRMIEQG